MKKSESVLQTLTRGGGFCCQHAFLKSIGIIGKHTMSNQEVIETAERVGVSTSTINRWNGKVRYKRIVPCSICRK